MHDSGRTILHFHLQRMIYHEPGTRQGEDIEALHDMRVATRRMRAALRLFGPYFDDKTRKWIQSGLQKTGSTLGAVRDWDVLIDHVRSFQAAQSDDQHAGLEALIDYWQKLRSRAQRQMLDYLDSDEYVDFVRRFLKFCQTQGAGKASSALVAHAAPVLIYQSYETVRAYEPGIAEAPLPRLHALRIDIKRFRYTLEFFETALGPQAREILDGLVAAQDHFGALQDADTAVPLITDAIKKLRKGASEQELDAARVYLEDRQADIQRLEIGAPEMLARITTPEIRHKLALTISTL
jgi:CHAD domain-containing protein